MSKQKSLSNKIQTQIKESVHRTTALVKNIIKSQSVRTLQSRSVVDQAKQQLSKLRNSKNNKFYNQSKTQSQYQQVNEFEKVNKKLDLMEVRVAELKQNLQTKKNQFNHHGQLQLSTMVTQQPEKPGLNYSNCNSSTQQNIYYISEVLRAYKDQGSLARQHITSTLGILKMIEMNKKPSEQQIKKKGVDLEMRTGYKGKKTVVFDLDQTLVHCNQSRPHHCDVKLLIKTINGDHVQAGINVRPYAREILANLSKHFQIVIFTASHSQYANAVINFLDQKKELVHHRLFRQNCWPTDQGVYIKDLRVMNRELKDIILVDNAAYSYAYQLQNAVPILPYYYGEGDCQLRGVQEYLMKLVNVEDVRVELSNTFRLHLYRNYLDQPQELVEQLYMPKRQFKSANFDDSCFQI